MVRLAALRIASPAVRFISHQVKYLKAFRANGLVLGEVADFEALTFNLELNFF
jgi:hypothetical protein